MLVVKCYFCYSHFRVVDSRTDRLDSRSQFRSARGPFARRRLYIHTYLGILKRLQLKVNAYRGVVLFFLFIFYKQLSCVLCIDINNELGETRRRAETAYFLLPGFQDWIFGGTVSYGTYCRGVPVMFSVCLLSHLYLGGGRTVGGMSVL